MEPKFIVQTTVSEDLIRLMSRQACRMPRTRLSRIIFVLVGIVELNLLFPELTRSLMMYSANGELFLSNILMYTVFCLFFLLVIVYGIFLVPLRIRRSFRKANEAQMGTVIVHTFYDDHCTCEYPGSSSSIQYDLIKLIQEDDASFIMHRTVAGGGIVLPKAAFILGTSEDFRSFLGTEKGKPFKQLR